MKIISLLLFSGMALFGIWQTFFYLRLKKTFDRWPVIGAQVTTSWLLNQPGADGQYLLEAVVHFSYSFRGQEYVSKTPALRGYDLFPSLEYERKLVKKYPKGEFVNARVHPYAPDFAYLEVAPLSITSTILAPLMAIGGVGLIIAYYYGVFEFLSFI